MSTLIMYLHLSTSQNEQPTGANSDTASESATDMDELDRFDWFGIAIIVGLVAALVLERAL